MAERNFNAKQALEREVKDLYVKGSFGSQAYAEAEIATSEPIVLTSAEIGSARNDETFTVQVAAAAANPTDTVLAAFTGTAAAIVCTITPNVGTNNPANAAAEAVLNLTADITLTSVAVGAGRNTNTFTVQVLAAAANPTDTVLVAFTGTAAAIVCTITPNNGDNNGASPVALTTAQLAEIINTGAVAAFTGGGAGTLTLTDASSRRVLQTAAGGDATALADAGEGDGVVGTFADGTTVAVDLTTEELVELINDGSVVGKTVTVTDASSLRVLQTAAGGDSTALADAGEGDGEVGTFADGSTENASLSSDIGIASIVWNDIGDYTITLEDAYNSLRYFRGIILSSTAADLRFQLKSDSIQSKSVRFLVLAGATPTDPADGVEFLIKFEVKNVAN